MTAPAVALIVVLAMMTLVWVASLLRRDASIVDVFWGLGFAVAAWIYFGASAEWTRHGALEETSAFLPWPPRRRPRS